MSLTDMIANGSANPLLLFVFALVLGALHGLEPGHSKTMMAAYIVAIQGTVNQAILLGVSAAFSHSIIVWVLAIVALSFGDELIGEHLEPYFMIVSGILVLALAAWMFWQGRPAAHGHHDHLDDNHQHHHDHHHHDHGHEHHHDHVAQAHGHSHSAGGHSHHHHDGEHVHDALDAPHLDAHARAHAAEIKARLASGKVGTWQTILFGLSGGLIPCPAAITVFILCLHLGQFALGITLVSAFSIGLALTLVGIGMVAAFGLKVMSSKTSRFDRLLDAAPWFSSALIAVVGLVIIWTGVVHLGQHDHVH
ncbi:MAG: nickel/cobalt efflux transporter [Pseudomonadota bacterium]